MLKHLALVEDGWFSHLLSNQDRQPPWDAVDLDADPDWEWHSAAADSPQQFMRLWEDAAARPPAAVGKGLFKFEGARHGLCLTG
jgi:uncharacterized damage-inducible protein DinB